MSTLRENKLYANLYNCEFWLDEVALLRHVISKEGISLDPAKIQVVREWPTPKTVVDIRSFLGLARYCRRFVKDFSKILISMTSVMKKNCKFV